MQSRWCSSGCRLGRTRVANSSEVLGPGFKSTQVVLQVVPSRQKASSFELAFRAGDGISNPRRQPWQDTTRDALHLESPCGHAHLSLSGHVPLRMKPKASHRPLVDLENWTNVREHGQIMSVRALPACIMERPFSIDEVSPEANPRKPPRCGCQRQPVPTTCAPLDGPKSSGKLYGLALATRTLVPLAGLEDGEVTRIEFEHSPSRSDPRFTNDRSAFDVFVEYKRASGKSGFLGIEVKYHEA